MELIKNLKEVSLFKNLFLAIFATIILAISAKVKIPLLWSPIPMTMQTFVVLSIGVAFGWKLGLFTVALYLVEGIAGLPVFAGTPEKGVGIIYFVGPTMGYLVGFLLAVFLTGYLKFSDWTKEGKRSFQFVLLNFVKLLLPLSIIYLLGVLWLSQFVGWEKVVTFGVKPFLLADLFKVGLLSLLMPVVLKFRKLTR